MQNAAFVTVPRRGMKINIEQLTKKKKLPTSDLN